METRSRTIAKTVSWRFFATLITMSIAWGFSGSTSLALSVGLADTTFKLFFFYGHERLWTRIHFGYSGVRLAEQHQRSPGPQEPNVPQVKSSGPRMHQSRRFQGVRKGGPAHFAWQRNACPKETAPDPLNAS